MVDRAASWEKERVNDSRLDDEAQERRRGGSEVVGIEFENSNKWRWAQSRAEVRFTLR